MYEAEAVWFIAGESYCLYVHCVTGVVQEY